MSGIDLATRDFNLTVDFDFPYKESVNVIPFNKILLFAFLFSLIVHLVFLLLKPIWFSAVKNTIPSVPLNVQIVNQPTPQATVVARVDAAPAKDTSTETPKPVASKPKIEISAQSTTANTTSEKKLELLSADDYVNLRNNNQAIDPSDNLAFNPHLKQLRQSKRVTQRAVPDQKSWSHSNGNTYYKSGGQCFMSLPQSGTSSTHEGKNWYLVSCPGKSESESMMDNVNREMKERFRQ